MAKSTLVNYSMFGAGADMSAASTTSAITSTKRHDNAGILVSWTGTSPVGSLDVQVSNDYNSDTGIGTWFSLNFGSAISISGNSGQAEITMTMLPFSNIRAVYTKVSGVGTLQASLSLKDLSGGAG